MRKSILPRRKPVLQAAALAALASLATLPAVAADSGYTLIKTIDLPGSKGGHGDYVVFDPATNTVWLAQSPDHEDVVIDAKTNTVKAVVPGIDSGNLITMTPKYAFLDDANSTKVTVLNKRTLKPVGSFTIEGKTPDGMIYDPKTGHIYVAGDDSNNVTVVKATPPFAHVATFGLQPEHAKDGPDVGTLVPATGMIYQPDDNVVDVINPATNKVVDVWKPDVKGDTKPMVYDPKTKHLFMGTTDKKMLVLDAKTGQQVASIPLQGSADEVAIDVGARRAFVGDKAGVVDVIDLDQNKIAASIPSEKKMHTLAVDPKTHRLYVYRNESNKLDVYSAPGS